VLHENYHTTINFDLMINFDFFLPNNLRFPHGMSVKFVFWTLHKLQQKQKNFDFIDFWLPYLWPNQFIRTWCSLYSDPVALKASITI